MYFDLFFFNFVDNMDGYRKFHKTLMSKDDKYVTLD